MPFASGSATSQLQCMHYERNAANLPWSNRVTITGNSPSATAPSVLRNGANSFLPRSTTTDPLADAAANATCTSRQAWPRRWSFPLQNVSFS